MLCELLLPCFEGVEDFGFAVVEEVVGDVADAHGGLRRNEGDVEDGVGEGGGVAEIAEEDADGVEGLGEVISACPAGFAVADAEGGAVAGEAAESGGDADGAAGVGADGDEGGAFLHAGRGAAGGAAGEQGCIARLDAVAVVGVFSGDAVGELMEVRFAGEDGAGVEKALCDPGVFCGDGIVLCVEARAATGDGACDVEAVFD